MLSTNLYQKKKILLFNYNTWYVLLYLLITYQKGN